MSGYNQLEDSRRGQLLEVLSESFGYDSFHSFQEQALEAVLSRQDSLTVISTGGGKSLCYQLPTLTMDGTAIVISPLISLMQDQVANLNDMGIEAAYLNSTQDADQRQSVQESYRAGKLDLLYMAPERLKFQSARNLLKSSPISYFVIDEAHCISQWGHDFRETYRNLHEIKQWFPDMNVHAFTATATPTVQDDIVEQLNLVNPVTTVGPVDRSNLTYRVKPRTDEFEQVKNVLDRHEGEAGIVYCLRRKDVDRLSEKLNQAGYETHAYHAGLSDDVRSTNQTLFQEEKIDVIVSTVAFGMGIDRANIRFIVHAAMPKTMENYQQETGRAGRDGNPAECLLLFGGEDYATWKKILSDSSNRDQLYGKLNEVADYCYQPLCRHRFISNYFGQEYPEENCGACDYCLGELETVDNPQTLAQKIVSCVARVDEQFGAVHVTDVLRGCTKEKIKKWNHDQLSTHGLLEHKSESFLRHMIDQLLGQQFLARDPQHRTLKITESGWQLLQGEDEPALVKPAQTELQNQQPETDSREPLPGESRELFEVLRETRSSLAESNDVPAYIIFPDRTLEELAVQQPESREALKTIHGVGEVKADKYGETFLATIEDFDPVS
ncbi:MAG: DNA helicase RecQ [bacterium]